MPRTTIEKNATSRRASRTVNVAERLRVVAGKLPEGVAVAKPGGADVAGQNTYATCSFAQLNSDADALARGLIEQGVEPGMKLALLVTPGVEFVKLVFALLRSGATTVLIDPGMGPKHVLRCLQAIQPDGFIAVSMAQALRTVLRGRFSLAKLNVTVGRRWFWGGPTSEQLREQGQASTATLPATQADDLAAIIFTSGSTGPAKGVEYTHQMFDTQAAEIQREYDLQPGGADLACFALFGLFNSAMGVTTVFPDMDFARPAQADPEKLLTAANDWQVTQAFASPAVWDKLSTHLQRTGERIETLRKVFSCGAPVPAEVLRRTLSVVQANAEMHTPYGATESLPVATIAASEVLTETAEKTDAGAGVCVGKKFATIDWRIIRITDESVATIAEAEELPHGEIGELIVRGLQVSAAYHDLGLPANHNAVAKIADHDGVWHRIGDVGYFDDHQRFWYCGRKSQRVVLPGKTLFTIPCEAVFKTHPQVSRAAVVGCGQAESRRAVVVAEPTAECLTQRGKQWQGHYYRGFAAELLELAQEQFQIAAQGPARRSSPADGIERIDGVLFHESLPVDVRHNAKINREALADWATQQLKTLS